MEIFLIENNTTNYIRIPILPPEFEITGSANIVTDNINALGQVSLYGGTNLFSTTLSSFFPKQNYRFASGNLATPGTVYDLGDLKYVTNGNYKPTDPYNYIKKINKWMLSGAKVRYIITDTTVNILCMIDTFTYREQDGTGDIYYDLKLTEYVPLSANIVDTLYSINKMGRDTVNYKETKTYNSLLSSSTSSNNKFVTYTVKKGDTLWDLAAKYLGKGDKWKEIYNWNGLKTSTIYVGQKLVIYLD